MHIRIAALLILAAGPAFAACPADGRTVLSCTAGNGARALDVCILGRQITYAYGPAGGAPDLTLTRDVAEIENQPWPGIGRTMWEETTFRNEGYAYLVNISVERMPDDDNPQGGVIVMQGDRVLANITCDPGTASLEFWAVSDAKRALGICWDLSSHRWSACD